MVKRLLVTAAIASALQPPLVARGRRDTVDATRTTISGRRTRLHAAPAPAYVAGACLTCIMWKPVVTQAMEEWYDNAETTFRRPRWAPPRKWFPSIWRVNYFLIGLAAARRARCGGLPLIALVHYALNMCWTPLFFRFRRLRAAVVLNAALVATLVAALPVFAEAGAAFLPAPYLCWLAFATALGLQIAR